MTSVQEPLPTGLGEAIARRLRAKILSGELGDGDTLPTQDELVAEFDVSLPSLRSALQILVAEGLLSVRRGRIGGAAVHVPNSDSIAYSMSLVLNAKQVPISDVRLALRMIEPSVVRLCAERADRLETVLPGLDEALAKQEAAVGDLVSFNLAGVEFHQQLVASCGNSTMEVMVGALEAVWSTHGMQAVREEVLAPDPAMSTMQRILADHRELLEAIRSGDADLAVRLARGHLQRFAESHPGDVSIDAELMRTEARRRRRARHKASTDVESDLDAESDPDPGPA